MLHLLASQRKASRRITSLTSRVRSITAVHTQTHNHKQLHTWIGGTRISTPEVDFPSLEFPKCTQRMVLEHVSFPLLKNQQLTILYYPSTRMSLHTRKSPICDGNLAEDCPPYIWTGVLSHELEQSRDDRTLRGGVLEILQGGSCMASNHWDLN